MTNIGIWRNEEIHLFNQALDLLKKHLDVASVVPELVQKNVVRRSVHSGHERELNEPLFQGLVLELNLVHLGRKKRERSFF